MTSGLVPDFEVKALLKPSEVVESNNQLKGIVLAAFFTNPDTRKMNVQFLDTAKKDMYAKDWNLRIRKIELKSKFELTYKKRYQIGIGPLSNAGGNIDAALETAKQDGFGPSYEAQVEVGYNSQTLSISRDEDISDTGFQGMNLPLVDDSRKFLGANAPKQLSDWGTGYLNESIIYGPVFATRYKGDWNGLNLSIEVWPIRTSRTDPTLEPIVEASFKASKLKKAMEGQAKLVGFLQQKGWFLAENSLRTKLIMERYGNLDASASE